MEQNKNKGVLKYITEILKWGLVLWLISPVMRSMENKVSFPRIMLGVLLFVLFIGKLFYDQMLDDYRKRNEKNKYMELLITVGMVTVVAVLIGAIAVFAGMFIFMSMTDALKEEE